VKVWFAQVYVEPGVSFPFSHLWQGRLSKSVSALAKPSPAFTKKFGKDFELKFWVSAKKTTRGNEIRGPGVYKKTKDVEYTVFLPFDVIMRDRDPPRSAMVFLLQGVCEVFERLEMETAKLTEKQDSLIQGICSDASMLAAPSWDPEDKEMPVRKVFEASFDRESRRVHSEGRAPGGEGRRSRPAKGAKS
jgi:hypothetical protein